MNVESLFLDAAVAKLELFTGRIAICLSKLTEDQIWARGHENENAVGNLILHLSGNVGQWIMAGLGGQPDVRVREVEFATESGIATAGLNAMLRDTVSRATAVIKTLDTERLTRIYEIQTRTVSGVEAVFNVVDHFAQHTGQIIYATKHLSGEDLGLVMPKKKAV